MVNRKRMIIANYTYDNIQPQAPDLEQVVLGAAMLEKKALITMLQLVDEQTFYLNNHKIIFRAIKTLFNEGKNVDMLTVTYKLKEMKKLETIGGEYYIATLTRRIASGHRTADFCLILIERWMRRELINMCSQAIEKAYSDEYNIDEEINNFSTKLLKLKEELNNETDIQTIATENLNQIEKIMTGEIKRYGISTCLTDIDNVINGLIAPDLIILAGRPGMGKTALALNIAKNLAINQNIPIGFISLEMSSNQLEFRLKSIISSVPISRTLRGNISNTELTEIQRATNIIKNSPINIYDKSIANISDIRSKAIEWKANHKIKLLIIDYIQLINTNKTRGQTRDQELGEITKALKSLAKELDVTIIALSQLNRNVEGRTPPEPRLSDLRESGSLEADADIVIMLYRPQYYDIKEVSYKGETITTDGLCFANIAKHRNGATGYIALNCNLAQSTFYDYGTTYNPNKWIEIE